MSTRSIRTLSKARGRPVVRDGRMGMRSPTLARTWGFSTTRSELAMPPQFKYCHGCEQSKSRSDFYSRPGRFCRACVKTRSRAYRESHLEQKRAADIRRRHRDNELERRRYRDRHGRTDAEREYHRNWAKANRHKQRDYNLRRDFGICLDDYEQMLHRQNGVCAICGRVYENRVLQVDHDHATGVVRGLLCHVCNTRLEWAQTHMDRIAAYLGRT